MSNASLPLPEPDTPAIRPLPHDPAPDLPRSPTSFVGRERETAAVGDLLARPEVRLVTLTGPGGVGKTRLALHLADRARESFHHVWYVALAPVRHPAHVAPAILRAIGVFQDVARPVGEEVTRATRGGSALLVLDNMEQVLDAWPLVADLLAACPTLRVLATSRAPLRISGEHVYVVPPMAQPETEVALDALGHADAIALFVERARAQDAGFALTAANAEAIAAICRELDGLPLAIELAAARIAAFSPAMIRDRLDARLSLLAEGPRDQPARLRSMRDSIAWSHDLLDDAGRELFRRLAVFAGPWTIGAAEAVAGNDRSPPVLDGLVSLVRDSLVRPVDGEDGETRYAMLETIREFAAERLVESGETDAMRDRHAACCQTLAAANAWAWFRPPEEGAAALRRIEAGHADFRAALDWLWRSGCDAELLDLAGILTGLWCVCGHVAEGQAWLERALASEVETDAVTRGQALGTLSWVLVQRGQNTRAWEIAERGIVMLEPEEASPALVLCLAEAGMAARHLGDFDVAFARVETAMSVLERIGDASVPRALTRNWLVSLEAGLGHSAMMQGDIERAAEHYGRARDRQVAGGHQPGASHIYGNHILFGLGDVARATGRPDEAMQHYRTSLEQAWQSGDVLAVAHAVGGIAGSLAVLGRHEEAATLFGASEAIHETHGFRFDLQTLDRQRALRLPEPWARADEPCGIWEGLRETVTAARRSNIRPLDSRKAAQRWEEGRRLSPEEAVAVALAGEPEAPVDNSGGLSPREVEVVRLLAEGLTDGEIAEALFISRRTAATHVRHIYEKLGVSTRAAAAAWAVRQGLA